MAAACKAQQRFVVAVWWVRAMCPKPPACRRSSGSPREAWAYPGRGMARHTACTHEWVPIARSVGEGKGRFVDEGRIW